MKTFTIILLCGLVFSAVFVETEAAPRTRTGKGIVQLLKKLGVTDECLDFIKKNIFNGGDINPMALLGMLGNKEKLNEIKAQLMAPNACWECGMKIFSKFSGGMDISKMMGGGE